LSFVKGDDALHGGSREGREREGFFLRAVGCRPSGWKVFNFCAFGRLRGEGRKGKGRLALRTVGCRPSGWKAFNCCFIGRLRGVRQGGAGYGASPPSRPPLHPPRSTPFRFSTSPGWRGLRVSCSGSFPPFGRVISLRGAQCHRALLLHMKAVECLPSRGTPQSGNSLFAIAGL